MNKKLLFWTPRLLAIPFILFISLFAFDVFFEGYGFWQALLGFLIHLIPTYLLTTALIIAWKWPLPGGIMFIALGLFYIIVMHGPNLISELILSLPAFVIGVLFILNRTLKIPRPIY